MGITQIKDFFDLPIEVRESISKFKNSIVKKYKLNDVCELILFHLCKQYCIDGYSEVDLNYLFNKCALDEYTIKKNIQKLFKKQIIGHRIKANEDAIFLRDEIIKNFDANFEEEFSNTNDKSIVDFLEENQNREDFEIIDLNTNKKVSVQEAVDIMIKNSSIYNDSEEVKNE